MKRSLVDAAIKRRAPLFKDGRTPIVASGRNLPLGGARIGMIQP